MSFDLSLFYFLNNLAGQSKVFDAVIVFSGDYLGYILILALLIIAYFSKSSLREKTLIFFAPLIAAGIARGVITEIIRFFYHKPRPFIIMQVHQLIAESGYSFPSGHATFFFAIAAALYVYNKKWGMIFFIASILMGVARVAAGVHYPSDILSGAIIGLIVGYITAKIGKVIFTKKSHRIIIKAR